MTALSSLSKERTFMKQYRIIFHLNNGQQLEATFLAESISSISSSWNSLGNVTLVNEEDENKSFTVFFNAVSHVEYEVLNGKSEKTDQQLIGGIINA